MCFILGINVNGTTRFGRTAVHAAVCRDHVTVLRMLMDSDADGSIADVYGNTPVHIAKAFQAHQCERRLRLSLLNLRGLSKTEVSFPSRETPRTFRKIRAASVPNRLLTERNSSVTQAQRHKSTSASAISRIRINTSQSKGNAPNNATNPSCFFNKSTKNERYWVVSRTDSGKRRHSDGMLEKKGAKSEDKIISAQDFSLPNGKFRVLKFKKDLHDFSTKTVDDSTVCQQPPRIHTPKNRQNMRSPEPDEVQGKMVQVSQNDQNGSNKYEDLVVTNGVENKENERTLEQNGSTTFTSSSFKPVSQSKPTKTVRFSAKSRY